MPLTPEQRTTRARVAARARWSKDDPRSRALARVEAKIRAAVEEAPPLPPDIRSRLVELIRAGASQEAQAA